jgi:hypothetical protein
MICAFWFVLMLSVDILFLLISACSAALFQRFLVVSAVAVSVTPSAFRLLLALFAVSVVTARFDAVASILFLSAVAVVSLVTPNAARLSFVA